MDRPFEITSDTARIRIGYRSPGLFRELDAGGKIDLARELGITVIEPQIAEHEISGTDAAMAYRQAADKAGIEIPSAGIMLAYAEPDGEAACRQSGQAALEAAAVLGVDYLFTAIKHPPEGIPHRESWERVGDRLRYFADQAEKAGIRLAIEPEWFLGSVERVVRMIETVDHPNLTMINFDATNFFLNGSEPAEVITRYADRVISGHIKDGFYRTNQHCEAPIGSGEVDWPGIFRLMLETGGDYTMHIEHCSSADQVRDAARVVRNVLDSLEQPVPA